MKKISKISRIKRIENDLREKEKEKGKTKNESNLDFDSMLKEEERKLAQNSNEQKKTNSLDAYKFEIQRSIIAQKKISQINDKEKEQEQEEK